MRKIICTSAKSAFRLTKPESKMDYKKFSSIKAGGKFKWMGMNMLRIEHGSLLGPHGRLPGTSAFSSFNAVDLKTGDLYYVQDLEIVAVEDK